VLLDDIVDSAHFCKLFLELYPLRLEDLDHDIVLETLNEREHPMAHIESSHDHGRVECFPGLLAEPHCTQLTLDVLTEEDMAEDHLVLLQSLVIQYER